eukprot:6719700-Prymnesium_polylepis.1
MIALIFSAEPLRASYRAPIARRRLARLGSMESSPACHVQTPRSSMTLIVISSLPVSSAA